MSLIPRRPSSTSGFLRKTLSILVWMASRPIFLGFNRTPYERSFYLLLSKNNQVINDWTKPRNNPLCRRLSSRTAGIEIFQIFQIAKKLRNLLLKKGKKYFEVLSESFLFFPIFLTLFAPPFNLQYNRLHLGLEPGSHTCLRRTLANVLLSCWCLHWILVSFNLYTNPIFVFFVSSKIY